MNSRKVHAHPRTRLVHRLQEFIQLSQAATSVTNCVFILWSHFRVCLAFSFIWLKDRIPSHLISKISISSRRNDFSISFADKCFHFLGLILTAGACWGINEVTMEIFLKPRRFATYTMHTHTHEATVVRERFI